MVLLLTAFNAGNNDTCEFTDQRGVTRPQPQGSACDIGAFELQQGGGGTPGDVNGNGQIQGDVDDLFLMIDAFFGANVTGNFDCNGDGDSEVQGDVDDLFCQIDKFFGS